jgi:hypothetical protein
MKSKQEMHTVIQSFGFILKSEQVRQKEHIIEQQKQQQKQYALYFRNEYKRLQFYHAYYFRQDVMNDTIYYNEMTWNTNQNDIDFLWTNYDHIFKIQVIHKKDIQRYATNYLIQCGRIIP